MKLEKNTGKSRSLLEWPVKARKSTKHMRRAMVDGGDEGC